MDNIYDTIDEFEKANDCQVIYLSITGSKLYGTDTSISDTDYFGLFLPSKQSLIQCTAIHTYSTTTGNSISKNSVKDVDVTLWSVHSFLDQLHQGRTGALDLLFSMYAEPILNSSAAVEIRDYSKASILTKNVQPYIGYALGQAERYGVKGKRHKELVTFTAEVGQLIISDNVKVHEYIDQLEKYTKDYHYITVKTEDTDQTGPMKYVDVLGKYHAETITMNTLYNRLLKRVTEVGERTKKAAEGADWKSLYSAARVMLEVHELLTTGHITFPLPYASTLLDIKNGNVPNAEVIEYIQEGLDKVDSLIDDSNLPDSVPNSVKYKLLDELYKD